MVSLYDALGAVQPLGTENEQAGTPQQQLLAKADQIFAALAARGAKVRRSKSDSNREDSQ